MRAIRKKQYIRYVELLKRKAYVYFYRDLKKYVEKFVENKTVEKELIASSWSFNFSSSA